MPAIINSDSGILTGSAGLKIHGNSDGILEIQNNGVTSLVVANNYIRVPVGNTATRPSVASAGMLRFNNQSNVFEVHSGGNWQAANFSSNTFILEYLVVAGGGAGGQDSSGGGSGGGGAGGALSGNIIITSSSISSFSLTAIVGGGGASVSPATSTPLNPVTTRGSNSSLSLGPGAIVTVGGGGGSTFDPGGNGTNAWPGGSGGGGAIRGGVISWYGDGVAAQGFPGGYVTSPIAPGQPQSGAGGGGATQAGANISGPGLGGRGGNGIVWLNMQTYAGGGGGGNGGSGGFGGGGASWPSPSPLRNGNVNTGGGGGAGYSPAGGGGAGGSGVILLLHSNTVANAIVSAGLIYSVNTQVSPGNILYEITAGVGTLTWR